LRYSANPQKVLWCPPCSLSPLLQKIHYSDLCHHFYPID
jgi:hypothetical protein